MIGLTPDDVIASHYGQAEFAFRPILAITPDDAIAQGKANAMVALRSADRHDPVACGGLVDAVPLGRALARHADKGRQARRRRRIARRAARRGVDRSGRLGRHRRAVERTLA